MKKILKLVFLVSLFLLVGCGKKNADGIIKDAFKKLDKSNSYYIEGEMEIINNEDVYTYSVVASYQKDDYYKIELVNNLNNHEQVILRNDDGVYVVTPSLNKSFKFQSDWPYNNSQIYLPNSILEDLLEDEDRESKTTSSGYQFSSSVNYPNNKALTRQNVYFDKNGNLTKAEVTDKDDNVQIKMTFKKIEYDKKFDKDYFELSKLLDLNTKRDTSNKKENNEDNNSITNNSNNTNIEENTNNNQNSINNRNNNNQNNNQNSNSDQSTNNQTQNNIDQNNQSTTNNSKAGSEETDSNNSTNTEQTATIDDIVYPMYLPNNTYLTNQERVETKDGERLILTFGGDSSFVLVEETAAKEEVGLVIPVNGEFDFLSDVIGVISTNAVSWHSNGIEYYMTSESVSKEELVNIARSISVLPVSK